MKPKTLEPKRQRSIFDFPPPRRPGPITVDLTDDLQNEENTSSFSVLCPVCNTNIESLEMNLRITHVEECLSLLTVREEKQERLEVRTTAVELEIKTEVSVAKVKNKPPSEEPKSPRKRKSLLPVPLQKYVNSGTTKKRLKRAGDASELEDYYKVLPSLKRSPVPDLKVLSFPTGNEDFQIAMDAFNYRPHESISKYFLSHFHSDHYGGITKKWCYERIIDDLKVIYCSTITAKLLSIRFNIDPFFMRLLETNVRYVVHRYDGSLDPGDVFETEEQLPGLYVTCIDANHCPGAVIFLFETIPFSGKRSYTLHCGDFRVCRAMLEHPNLAPFHVTAPEPLVLDKLYLDTTYMNPNYNFPKQELVCHSVSEMFHTLNHDDSLFSLWYGTLQSRITDFLTAAVRGRKKRFLILVGTYVIGKEKLAIAILKRMNNCPIYVSNINSRGDKAQILATYEDEYLNLVLCENASGTDDCTTVVHLVPMKIVSAVSELANYFNHNKYFQYFERCVGLRPTGWTFLGPRGVTSSEKEPSPIGDIQSVKQIADVLHSQPEFAYQSDILEQFPLPNTKIKKKQSHDDSLYKIYTLPYSEHSSFRELSYIAVFLNTREIIPTVNTGNEWSVARMKSIIETWELARKIKVSGLLEDEGLKKALVELSLDDF